MQTAGAAPSRTVFVLDTHTGQVWYRQTIASETWVDTGRPTLKDGKPQAAVGGGPP
jgi:hypothetical protein